MYSVRSFERLEKRSIALTAVAIRSVDVSSVTMIPMVRAIRIDARRRLISMRFKLEIVFSI